MTFKFGQRISKQLSDYLRKYTSKDDELDVAELPTINVGHSIIRQVKFRQTTLASKEVAKAITELMRTAIRNSKQVKEDARKAIHELNKMIA